MMSLCLTVSLNFNAKQCRQYMQEGRRNVEGTGSIRYHDTFWHEIGSDGTFQNIDGLLYSAYAGSPTLIQFKDSETQMQSIYYYITEVSLVLVQWGVVYAMLLFC